MSNWPKGHYVYAIMDGGDPIYIGKGTKGRAWNHLTSGMMDRAHYMPLYAHIKEMREAGREPEVLIIKDDLNEQEGYASEAAMIELVGTQGAGTGTLCNLDSPLRGAGVRS